MVKKLKNNAGFTLIEILTAIGILVILIGGMDAGIQAGMRAYSDSIFESNSASMEGIINNAISDVLRYSEDVVLNPSIENPSVPGFQDNGSILTKEEVPFVFSNFEYGIRNGYFRVMGPDHDTSSGVIQIKELQKNDEIPAAPVQELINSGSYPNMEVANLDVSYVKSGHYFDIRYEIVDLMKSDRAPRICETTVRMLNPDVADFVISSGGSSSGGGTKPNPNPAPNPGGGGSKPDLNPTPNPGGSGSGGDVPGGGNAPGGEEKPGMKPSNPGISEYEVWSGEVEYHKGDIVQSKGELYVAKETCINMKPANDKYWEPCTLWKPQVSYKVGDVVAYNQKAYKCIMAHPSQDGWDPETVPSLWEKY